MEWQWEPVVMEKKKKGITQPEKERKKVDLLRDERYDCAFCSGTGEKPKGSVCSVCRGSKRIQLTPPVVKCASCKGRGEEKPRTNITCTPCRGKGYVSVVEPVEVCSTCNGVGRTRGSNLACVQCKGIGAITVSETQTYGT
ncbi:hypothetical protein KAW55_00130 [bacterium]|nr:hypothetical protein [bacterium]